MKEREFLGYVLDVARRFGWRAWHVPMPVQRVGGGAFVPDPRGAGIPDLILMHAGPPARLVFAELKTDTGLRPEQEEFLALAGKVALASQTGAYTRSVGAYVWTPDDRDELELVLKSRALVPL